MNHHKQSAAILNQAITWVLLTFLIASLTACAQPGSTLQIDNKLDVLERRIVSLERQDLASIKEFRKENEEYKRSLSLQISDLQESLKGFIETLDLMKQEMESNANKQNAVNEKLEINGSKIDELQKRLGDQLIELNKIKGFFKASIEADLDSSQELPAVLAEAMGFFKEKRFEESSKLFISFRENFPQSKYVDDALFYIAYGHFLRGEMEKASLYFFELIRQFPDSNRHVEAKWWLAAVLEQTGDRKGSMDLYSELAMADASGQYQKQAEMRFAELESGLNE